MRSVIASIAVSVLGLLLLCVAASALAQQCPSSTPTRFDVPSNVQSLGGSLIYHDGIRQWYELKLDKRICGHASIQLVPPERISKHLETLRGCRVKSSGRIDFSMTGYYSLDLYQDVSSIRPNGPCAWKQPFRDYSNERPDARVHSYTVAMHFDYRPGDHPVTFQVRSAGKELRPWQVYAGYWLTGGSLLYGQCGHGFVVAAVSGPQSALPSHSDEKAPDDMAMFDPENAAAKGKFVLDLEYTCVREAIPRH